MRIGNLFSLRRKAVVIICWVSAIFFLPASGRALLTSADWLPASEDGWITRDTASGLDWLDVTLTANQTFDQVRTGIWYERGFRHATIDELRTLFIHAGTPDDGFDTVVSATHRVETLALISLVGATSTFPDGGSTTMGFAGSDGGGNVITTASYPVGVRFSAVLGKLQVSPSWGEAHFTGGHPFSDEASPSWGSFLVRATPPPLAVSNISPLHKATGIPLSPKLQIEAFFPNGSGKAHRSTDWEVSSDVAFSEDTVVFKSLSDRRNLTALIVPSGCLKPDTTYYWRARTTDTEGQSSPSDLSLTTSFRTEAVTLDARGVVVDGIAVKRLDVQVVNLNGLTDAELKGIGTVSASLVAAFPAVNAGLTADTTREGMMIARANGGSGNAIIGMVTPAGVRIASLSTMTTSDPGFNQTTVPPKTTFPHGIVGFRLTGIAPGSSVDVRLYLPEDLPSHAVWYKYHPAWGWLKVDAAGTHDGGGSLLSASTRFVVTDGIGVLTVTDNDPLIDFSTEISGGNAVIVDPGGVGIPVVASDGGCFIATAAYGSALEPRVATLRAFRDRYLLHHPWGRAFVSLYYAYSPRTADFIAGHDTLRAAVRLALLPLIGFIGLALTIGILPAFAGLVVIPGLGIIGWRMMRNRGRQQG